MSTVKSLSFYHDLKGIADEITLTHAGDNDWGLVVDKVGASIASEYGCAFLWVPQDYADVKMIWACERSTPWLDAYCELIYSDSKSWLAKHGEELRESFRHWIYQAGMHGYLPETSQSFSSLENALDEADSQYELNEEAMEELRNTGMVDIDETNSSCGVSAEHSLWYISIEKCTCSNPEEHSDN